MGAMKQVEILMEEIAYRAATDTLDAANINKTDMDLLKRYFGIAPLRAAVHFGVYLPASPEERADILGKLSSTLRAIEWTGDHYMDGNYYEWGEPVYTDAMPTPNHHWERANHLVIELDEPNMNAVSKLASEMCEVFGERLVSVDSYGALRDDTWGTALPSVTLADDHSEVLSIDHDGTYVD